MKCTFPSLFSLQDHKIETFLIKRDEPLRPKQKHRGLLPPNPRRALRTPSMILNAGLLASALSSVNHRLSRDASLGTLGLSSSDRDSRHSSGDSSAHSEENGTALHPRVSVSCLIHNPKLLSTIFHSSVE